MTHESCPACGASLVVTLPAVHVPAAATTTVIGEPPATSVPPILACPDCERYWVRRGARLRAI